MIYPSPPTAVAFTHLPSFGSNSQLSVTADVIHTCMYVPSKYQAFHKIIGQKISQPYNALGGENRFMRFGHEEYPSHYFGDTEGEKEAVPGLTCSAS